MRGVSAAAVMVAIQAVAAVMVTVVMVSVSRRSGQGVRTPPPSSEKGHERGKGSCCSCCYASGPIFSPTGERGSQETVPMVLYNAACGDRDLFCHKREDLWLAAEAASRLQEEMERVKKGDTNLQDELLECEHQKACTEA